MATRGHTNCCALLDLLTLYLPVNYANDHDDRPVLILVEPSKKREYSAAALIRRLYIPFSLHRIVEAVLDRTNNCV